MTMKSLIFACILFPVLSFAQSFTPAFASTFTVSNAGEEDETTLELIAETEFLVPGEPIHIALVMHMRPGWHSYWINPGESGMPTSLDWDLPEGFSTGDILWPVPQRFLWEGLVSFGYEGEVVLLVPLTTPDTLTEGKTLTLKVDADWLECEDICLPKSGSAELNMVVGESPGERNPRIEAAVEALPREPGGGVRVRSTADGAELRVEVGETDDPFVKFFPLTEGAWVLEPAPEVQQRDGEVRVRLRTAPTAGETAFPKGVLVSEEGRALEITSALEEDDDDTGPVIESSASSRGLFGNLAIAFFAGIGMNLLPCIFPVLGLKISGFVEQAHGNPKSVKSHALVFAAGVLISLWILAAVVGLLGAAWGAQFQDPRVVIGMTLVLTFFTMNLFGVFELGNSLTTVGGDLTRKQGYGGSFFQGVLLTVIGTPCTGPVLAVIIVWMLTQPVWIGFLAFTLMGVGMALPYVALAYSPSLIDKLPRPGTWMVTFKQASAFMIVLFLWVLLYVLRGLVGGEAVVQVAGAMMLVCLAAWILGTWGAPGRSARAKRIAVATTVGVLAVAGWTGFSISTPETELSDSLQARIDAGEPIRWSDVSSELAEILLAEGVKLHYRPFSPELVESLREEGHRVFVDFTADWCTICKINKVRALHRDEVMTAFADHNVVTLRADWTARDQEIADVLESYGRRGIPVYLLYDDIPGTPATLLPETLRPEVIFDALAELDS